MFLRRLELTDIRSYTREALDFDSGITVIIGQNAHGKTNLLEAVYRLATGSSYRVSSDLPLVRHGARSGVARASMTTDGGRHRIIELELRPGEGSRIRLDGQPMRRPSEAVGALRVVLFAPEDVAVVRGDAGERRRFLDDLAAQRRPAYAMTRSEFERVLRQRNRLLRSARPRLVGGEDPTRGTLDVWTEQLVEYGGKLTAARLWAMHALAGPTADFYHQLVDRPEPVELRYRSSAGFEVVGGAGEGLPDHQQLVGTLRDAAAAVAGEERRRGMSLFGPQRDDLAIVVGGLPARGYASQGQLWSLALSLRLATYEVLASVGDRPVVLLDDVFTELDETRRTRLASACERWEQVLVTAAVERDVPLVGRTIDVWRDADGSHAAPRDRSTVA